MHLQVLLRMGCPFIAGMAGMHAHTAHPPPPAGSLPGASPGSGRASFSTIVPTVIGIWKHCKNASVFSYMEIIAKKVLVWGKVISFLEGGEPSFSGEGRCCIVVQRDPTQVTVLVRKWLPARPPGAGRLGPAQRVGGSVHRCPGERDDHRQTLTSWGFNLTSYGFSFLILAQLFDAQEWPEMWEEGLIVG